MSIRSESPSQVFFILLTWLRALISSGSVASEDLKNIFIAYDNMCNLCRLRVAKKPLPLPSPMDQAWLQVHKIIDTFHLKNHTSTICHTVYNPERKASLLQYTGRRTDICLDGEIQEHCMCHEQNPPPILHP